jgi:hypothetical protein
MALDWAPVLVQVVTTLGTIATVVITGRQNRKGVETRVDDRAKETHERIDTLNKRVSGEWMPVQDTPAPLEISNDRNEKAPGA